MKRINPTLHLSAQVFSCCLTTVQDTRVRAELEGIIDLIAIAENNYNNYATTSSLHLFLKAKTISGISNEVLRDLYTKGLASEDGPCRDIYNEIMSSAPSGLCPYCLVTKVSQLDHVLPKSSYGNITVMPKNLVPSCRDCNTAKGARTIKIESDQLIHPYYYDIPPAQWLFGRVLRTTPLTFEFYVNAPTDWPPTLKTKVDMHFKTFKLQRTFSLNALNEFGNKRGTFEYLFTNSGREGLKEHLRSELVGREKHNINSWQTAFYTALVDDEWFIDGGFVEIAV